MLIQVRKSFRPKQILGLLLISITLIFLNQNLQANRDQTKTLENIQERLGVVELEINKIRDQLNESRAESAENIESTSRPLIVIRLDDVGNFALAAQIEIIEFHLANNIPLSLGIIPSTLESEGVLLGLLRKATQEGYEISAHGWTHENFTEFGVDEQIQRLNTSRNMLRELLGANLSVFIPPHNELNSDTIVAMKATGFSILSTDIKGDLLLTGEGIFNYPATVSFSLLSDEEWVPKSLETLALDIMRSVERNRYAVILVHPQEFMREGELDFVHLSRYKDFIRVLNEAFSLCSFSDMAAG